MTLNDLSKYFFLKRRISMLSDELEYRRKNPHLGGRDPTADAGTDNAEYDNRLTELKIEAENERRRIFDFILSSPEELQTAMYARFIRLQSWDGAAAYAGYSSGEACRAKIKRYIRRTEEQEK